MTTAMQRSAKIGLNDIHAQQAQCQYVRGHVIISVTDWQTEVKI